MEKLIEVLMSDNLDEDILIELVPELLELKNCTQNHPAHSYNVLTHSLKVVAGVPKDPILRLTALFHDIGKPDAKTIDKDGIEHFTGHQKISVEKTKKIFDRYSFEELYPKDRYKIFKLIEKHDNRIIPKKHAMVKYLQSLGMVNFERLMLHQKSDLLAHSQSYIERKWPLVEEISKVYEEEIKSFKDAFKMNSLSDVQNIFPKFDFNDYNNFHMNNYDHGRDDGTLSGDLDLLLSYLRSLYKDKEIIFSFIEEDSSLVRVDIFDI